MLCLPIKGWLCLAPSPYQKGIGIGRRVGLVISIPPNRPFYWPGQTPGPGGEAEWGKGGTA